MGQQQQPRQVHRRVRLWMRNVTNFFEMEVGGKQPTSNENYDHNTKNSNGAVMVWVTLFWFQWHGTAIICRALNIGVWSTHAQLVAWRWLVHTRAQVRSGELGFSERVIVVAQHCRGVVVVNLVLLAFLAVFVSPYDTDDV